MAKTTYNTKHNLVQLQKIAKNLEAHISKLTALIKEAVIEESILQSQSKKSTLLRKE